MVEGFEQRFAELLGKEAAVLMPSGTMAQQIALRIHCAQRNSDTVAFHPTCHLESTSTPAMCSFMASRPSSSAAAIG